MRRMLVSMMLIALMASLGAPVRAASPQSICEFFPWFPGCGFSVAAS